jgi:hypothetical protein
MPDRLGEEELADWRAGRNALYQLAALTIGARLAVAGAQADTEQAELASAFAKHPLDRFYWHPAKVGNLGDRHPVSHQGSKARQFLYGDLGCGRSLRADRRIDCFLTNRHRRQDWQHAWFARLRLRRIRSRLFGGFRFRCEERLGGLARAHDLLAITAAELALLSRAVEQELPRTGWLVDRDVPVRWSCRTGVCHNCETGLISGSVLYRPDPVEPPADGNLLICCSQPQSDIALDL